MTVSDVPDNRSVGKSSRGPNVPNVDAVVIDVQRESSGRRLPRASTATRSVAVVAGVAVIAGLTFAWHAGSETESTASSADSADAVTLSLTPSRWVGAKEHRFFGKFSPSVYSDEGDPPEIDEVESDDLQSSVASDTSVRSVHKEITPDDLVAQTPDANPSQTASLGCYERSMQMVRGWLNPLDIPTPTLIISETSLSTNSLAFYNPATKEIVSDGCPAREVLAHEVGHYIVDFRAGSWANHITFARDFCLGFDSTTARCEGGWLSDAGLSYEAQIGPGVEHAAHCAAYNLIGDSMYTRCPDPNLVEAAAGLMSGPGPLDVYPDR